MGKVVDPEFTGTGARRLPSWLADETLWHANQRARAAAGSELPWCAVYAGDRTGPET